MIKEEETNLESTKIFFETIYVPMKTMEDADRVRAKIEAMSLEELQDLHTRLHTTQFNIDLFHAALMATITKKELMRGMN